MHLLLPLPQVVLALAPLPLSPQQQARIPASLPPLCLFLDHWLGLPLFLCFLTCYMSHSFPVRLIIPLYAMDMKKVSTAIIVAAASMSAVMAAGSPAPSPSAGGSIPSSSPGSATASGPDSSVAAATLPVLGSLVGASIVTLFSYMLHV
ncbi:hypothetical protein Gotur_010907 [Gossypium turneri]